MLAGTSAGILALLAQRGYNRSMSDDPESAVEGSDAAETARTSNERVVQARLTEFSGAWVSWSGMLENQGDSATFIGKNPFGQALAVGQTVYVRHRHALPSRAEVTVGGKAGAEVEVIWKQ